MYITIWLIVSLTVLLAWINNCVGHFNHRHFILFCIFVCLGTLYVTVSARTLFIKHFFHDRVSPFKLKKKSNKSIYIAHIPCEYVHMRTTNINRNLEMLVFEERGKPEYPEKNLSEQGREPTTNSTHI